MRRIIENTLVMLVFCLTVFANGQELRFGVKGGFTASDISKTASTSKDGYLTDERRGYHIGALLMYPILSDGNKLFVQSELLYVNQGQQVSQEKLKRADLYLNYINVPILLKYYFTDTDGDFFVEGGPQVSFLVSKKIDKRIVNIPTKFKSYDIGLALGGGFSFSRHLELNARGTVGAMDVIEDKDNQNMNVVLYLGVSYIF